MRGIFSAVSDGVALSLHVSLPVEYGRVHCNVRDRSVGYLGRAYEEFFS